jgi:outer membrane lipoprotein carrier protein
MVVFRALWIAVLIGACACPAAAQQTEAQAHAADVQKNYDTVRNFSTDFTHSYRGGVLHKTITERGHLFVQKPGRMRWEYKSPDEKLFVSDGVKVYSYVPEDKQVIVSSVPPQNEATTPAMFLAGKGNVTRDFTPSIVDPPEGFPADTRALKLVPRTPQADYDWLILLLAPRTLELRGLVTTDAQGGISTFTFTNFKENVDLSDNLFTFKIPRGVDVVTDSSGR